MMTLYTSVPNVVEKHGKLSPYLEKAALQAILAERTILPAAAGAVGAPVQVVPGAINNMLLEI
jgi:hypothetical protein